MDRRRFVQMLSAGMVGAAFGENVPAAFARSPSVAASDQIRLGVIGVGSKGKSVMQDLLRVPGVRVGALCDVFAPRLAEGRRIAGEQVPVYADYRKMLDERAGELDAVLVASPIRHHADQMVAGLECGLHVYGEKSMAYDLEGCRRVVQAAGASGRHFQVGHQYRYSPWAREAVRRIHAGEIGTVTHIFGYWHRNNNWRRPVPAGAVEGWSGAELERLINWRLYTESSRGLLAELGSHHLDFANWIFADRPRAAVGSGGIISYHDGRETFDHVHTVFEYPRGRQLVFSSLLNNHRIGYQLQVVGTAGSVVITLEDATIYFEPKRPNSAVALDEAVTTGPTLSTKGDQPYRGEGERIEAEGGAMSPGLLAAGNFVDSIRENTRPWTDERVGWGTAVPVIFGDQATRAGGRVEFAREIAAVPAPAPRAADA